MFGSLSTKIGSVFNAITGNNKFSESNLTSVLSDIREALLDADVPYSVVNDFIDQVKEEVIGQKVLKSLNPSQHFTKVVHQKIKKFLGDFVVEESALFKIPSKIMVMGLQGSGKTTTISKLSKYISDLAKKRGKSRRILLASVDFYRPAAIDQLEILAASVGVDFYRAKSTNIISAVKEIEAFYKSGSYDHIFLDTAGRLHVENSLLKELQEIDTSFGAHYKILVLDSMTGQESLSVAQAFNSVVPFSYAIFTKMDSDTRGGAAFAFSYVIKKPIIFTGVGERPEDLEKFNPERAAGKILGMGDVLTLVEKAEEKIKVEDQEKMAKTLMSGKFNLNDFLNQITMIEKMGSFSKLVKYMPNVGGMSLSDSQIEQSERDTKRFKAIIQSMTLKERFNPDLLNGSSKLRIAKGSGSKVEDVNLLLDRFEQSKQFAKILKKYNKFF